MEQLKRYKKRVRKLFFLSVKKDINIWRYDSSDLYCSYDEYNYRLSKGCLLVKYFSQSQKIKRYRFLGFIPIDFKVYYYSLIIRHNIKTKNSNLKNKRKIVFLKEVIGVLEKHLK